MAPNRGDVLWPLPKTFFLLKLMPRSSQAVPSTVQHVCVGHPQVTLRNAEPGSRACEGALLSVLNVPAHLCTTRGSPTGAHLAQLPRREQPGSSGSDHTGGLPAPEELFKKYSLQTLRTGAFYLEFAFLTSCENRKLGNSALAFLQSKK